jgi:hypothetical protein
MDIGPTPELREACRRVLGGDDPATVIDAIRAGDARWRRVQEVHAEILAAKRAEVLVPQGERQ